MVEALALHGAGPGAAGGVEQVDGADHVGFDKREGVADGAVYVALGGKVDHAVGLVAVKEVVNGQGVADVDALKAVVRGLGHVGQVFEVAGVGQGVDVDNRVLRVALNEAANDVRADESGSAGDKNRSH